MQQLANKWLFRTKRQWITFKSPDEINREAFPRWNHSRLIENIVETVKSSTGQALAFVQNLQFRIPVQDNILQVVGVSRERQDAGHSVNVVANLGNRLSDRR